MGGKRGGEKRWVWGEKGRSIPMMGERRERERKMHWTKDLKYCRSALQNTQAVKPIGMTVRNTE